MFLNYTQPIEWSPEFYSSLFQDNLYLLSELKQYAMPAQKLTQIQSWIESQTPIKQAIRNIPAKDTISIYQTLDTLHSQGVIRNFLPSKWSIVDTQLPVQVINHQGYLLYDLCNMPVDSEIHTLLKSLSEQLNCSIISLDDYLDPRLQSLTFPSDRNLIVKLTNKQHYLGPFFKDQVPCFYCMQHSVGRNQPLRMWLENKQNKSVVIPHIFHPLSEEYQSHIVEILERQLTKRWASEIIQITPANTDSVQHRWHHFAHCSECNLATIANNQITLNSCLKHNGQKGGCRHISPEQTLENIRPFIGSLSGIISTAGQIKEQKKLPYKTYKSSFFRNIPCNKDPLGYCNELTSLGKGITSAQAEVSALCESFERYGAHCQDSDIYLLTSFNKLQGKAIHPDILIGLTEKQKVSLEEIDYPAKRASHGSLEFDPTREIHWHPCWSLTSEQTIYVPMCYALAGAPEDIKYCAWNSNGCAAGNTQEEAILQGFLEVVERDAIATWWYNKIQLAEVSLDLLSESQNQQIMQTLGLQWEYWVLDATHDFEIPVFSALARHKNTGTIMFGFGCHLSPEIAIERAITELCQLISVSDQHCAPFDFDEISEEKHLYPNSGLAIRTKSDFVQIEHQDIRDDIYYCIEKARSLDLDTLVIPYQRPELPVQTVKVVIPGTVHIWPQFALTRLYRTPVKKGWLKQALTEKELNKHMLYV